ncbi:MAG: metallophosphoesterase family protein [Dethiobacteria bacterium]
MALKVFHTGDLHLGMLYMSRGYPEEIRRELVEARFRTLEKMVEKANAEECQLFVVTGDLFERLNIKEEQILRAARALSSFSGVCGVLPGNHDYYIPGGLLWEKFCEYAGDNIVTLFECRPYNLKDFGLDATLYPAPCWAKHSSVNGIKWIFELAEKPETRWHLGLAHGTVEGYSPDFDQHYYPMQEEEIVATGLDFWFLGHTHVRLPARDEFLNGYFAYCGTPEPDGFDCWHEGSAWIIRLGEEVGVEGKAVITGHYTFKDLEKTVNKATEIEALARELSGRGDHTLARLKLQGILPRADFENRHYWRDKMKERLFYLEWNDTLLQMEINRDTIGELFTEGSFPFLLLERLAKGEDRKALQLAYALINEVKK